MAEVKLTPEWLMDEAERLRRYGCDAKLESACRLAARALRAREWLRETMIAASMDAHDSHTGVAWAHHMKARVCEDTLAILEGREP